MRLEVDGLEPLEMADDRDGDLVVVEWDPGAPEVRSVNEPRPAADGETDSTMFYGARAITIALRVHPLNRQETLDRLNAYCRPSLRPWLYVSDGGAERRIQVRCDPSTGTYSSPSGLDRGLLLKAPVPFFEAAEPIEAWIRPLAATPGRTYSRTYPRTYPAGGGAGVGILNEGNMPAEWVARIFGACQNPHLSNATTGEELSFTGLTIAASDYVEIDSAAQTIRLNGQPGANRFHLLDVASEWFTIQPGANTVVFSATSPGATCQTEVVTRSTYL